MFDFNDHMETGYFQVDADPWTLRNLIFWAIKSNIKTLQLFFSQKWYLIQETSTLFSLPLPFEILPKPYFFVPFLPLFIFFLPRLSPHKK